MTRVCVHAHKNVAAPTMAPLLETKTDPSVLHEPVVLITIIINLPMFFILEKSDWLSRILAAESADQTMQGPALSLLLSTACPPSPL